MSVVDFRVRMAILNVMMVIQDWLSGEQFKTDSMLSEDVGTSVELLPPERQAREQQP